jgi:hypothetical protein
MQIRNDRRKVKHLKVPAFEIAVWESPKVFLVRRMSQVCSVERFSNQGKHVSAPPKWQHHTERARVCVRACARVFEYMDKSTCSIIVIHVGYLPLSIINMPRSTLYLLIELSGHDS